METKTFAILFPLLVVTLFYAAFMTLHYIRASKELRGERKDHDETKEMVVTLSKKNHALAMRQEITSDAILEAEIVE